MRPDMRRAGTGAVGFTLIEVLMASFIIALGALGLAALFAGAARQQQVASDTTRSVSMTKSAESMLVENFGLLQGPGLTNLPADRWFPCYANTGFNYLTVDPLQNGSAYFTVPAIEPIPVVLYERPMNPPTAGFGVGQMLNPSAPPIPFAGNLIEFGQRRLVADTLSPIQVTIRTHCGLFGGGAPSFNTIDFIYYPPPSGPEDPNIKYYIDSTKPPPSVYPPTTDFIAIDVQDIPIDGADFARVHSFDFSDVRLGVCPGGGFSKAVERIVVLDYQFKNDRLISLSDRIIEREDSRAPGGRRAQMAFSVLYRRTSGNTSQLAVVTYSLEPDSAASVYVPPETRADFDGDRAPLRRVELRLAYDDTAERYTVSVDDPDLAWAVEPGQQIIFEGEPGSPGSDFAVRVLGKRVVDDEHIGFLERGPRGAGAPLLPDRTVAVDRLAWVLQDVVRSREDGSRWRIRPVEVRLFQVR